LQIPLKEGIEGEREGDFTDNFIVRLLFLGKKNPKNSENICNWTQLKGNQK
jgi:hypothetical protein